MKLRFFDRYLNAARRLPGDEDGIVLIWVTIMMIAIMALSGLALDASRYRSLKTQMQAGADALALAGARELDGSRGSITRATNAINNMISNTPEGMGTQSKITAATITFYSSLYDATNADIGVVTTADGAAKYVGVTTSSATIDPILVNLPLSTNAMAVAGYDFAVCNMPPVFICNPYETSGMDDAAASQALRDGLDTTINPDANRRQMLLSVTGGSGYGPGHFGFLMPPDGCNGANCLRNWIATYKPRACYRKKTVDLNTGQMQSVFDAFNVRFDMYSGNVKNNNPDYPPAINVRRGYQATGNNWCNAAQATPYYTTQAPQPISLVTVTTTGATGNGNNCNAKNSNNPCLLKVSHSDATTISGLMASGAPHAVGPSLAAGATVTSVCINATSGNCPSYGIDTILLSNPIPGTAAGAAFTIGWPTSGLPRDTAFDVNGEGNGNWDCANYWAINHPGRAIPTDMTDQAGSSVTCGPPALNTASRYDVYQYENTKGTAPLAPAGSIPPLVEEYSFPGLSKAGVEATDRQPNSQAGAENGAPKCFTGTNPPWVSSDDGGGDRRTIYAAAINCMAQSAKMNQGGQTADGVPVAGFLKFFLTEPVDTANGVLIGEVSGLVGLDKNAKNNVQLYR